MFNLTYSEYDGKHCTLNIGPIDLGATGKIAIIYKEAFQFKVIQTSLQILNEWHWYVDDSEIKCMKEEAQQILDHLNNIEPGVIVFTKEDQEGDVLHQSWILKLRVSTKPRNIGCTVHYKKIHTNINVQERSNYPNSMNGITKGL